MTIGIVATAAAEVGMFTLHSGSRAGLGVAMRDGLPLAVKQSGRDDIEVVIGDEQPKPEVAGQLANRIIQAERVDMIIGIVQPNLAVAIVPSFEAWGQF